MLTHSDPHAPARTLPKLAGKEAPGCRRRAVRGTSGRVNGGLVAALLAVAVAGTGVWVLLTTSPEDTRGTVVPAEVVEIEREAAPESAPLTPLAEEPEPEAPALDASLVPLDVSLELMFAQPAPRADVRPRGSGRAATLRGRLADASGEGFEATISIASGANAGRQTRSFEDGTFLLGGLHPGLAIVSVEAPGIVGARREVRLGAGRTSELNVGFGRLAYVRGRVIERRRPLRESDADLVIGIPAVKVTLDGQVAFTDEEGYFSYAGVAGGAALLELELEEFGGVRQTVHVTAGRPIEPKQLTIQMRAEAGLNFVAKSAANRTEPALVFLVPSKTNVQNGFPWHTINPIQVFPGTTVRVDGLPAVGVEVRAFHGGSTVRVSRPRVTLREGDFLPVELSFQPAASVTGKVYMDGKPVAGARVTLEAPDQTRATLAYFKRPNSFLETEVLPILPPARQTAVTGASGIFRFTAWSEAAPKRYLEARTADGKFRAGRIVDGPGEGLDLHLESLASGEGDLALDFPGRGGPVEVQLRVDGREDEAVTVPAGAPLRVEALPKGQWRLKVESGGRLIEQVDALGLYGQVHRTVELPREPGTPTSGEGPGR